MERARIFVFEPSEFLRLFIRRALEGSEFTIINEAGTLDEATRLIDLDRKHEADLVLVSDQFGIKAAKHIIDHLSRGESKAKTIGIYAEKTLWSQRVKVTSEIKHDDIVNNSGNLRDLISQI